MISSIGCRGCAILQCLTDKAMSRKKTNDIYDLQLYVTYPLASVACTLIIIIKIKIIIILIIIIIMAGIKK